MILFLHYLGVALWMGASLTFMVWGPSARTAPLAVWAHTWDTLARVQRAIVAPGCLVAMVSGVVLTMRMARAGGGDMMMWLVVMQALGILAAVLTLAIATPLANRMALLASASLAAGTPDPRAEPVRRKLALVGSISGVFLLVTLYFAAAKPA